MVKKIRSHKDLDVYNMAFDAAMKIFKLTENFPIEERYSLTDQIRRSSRSVCASISEAWRNRRYPKAFVSKLNNAESEAAETQVWLDFCEKCEYLDQEVVKEMNQSYDYIIGKIVNMIRFPEKWTL